MRLSIHVSNHHGVVLLNTKPAIVWQALAASLWPTFVILAVVCRSTIPNLVDRSYIDTASFITRSSRRGIGPRPSAVCASGRPPTTNDGILTRKQALIKYRSNDCVQGQVVSTLKFYHPESMISLPKTTALCRVFRLPSSRTSHHVARML